MGDHVLVHLEVPATFIEKVKQWIDDDEQLLLGEPNVNGAVRFDQRDASGGHVSMQVRVVALEADENLLHMPQAPSPLTEQVTADAAGQRVDFVEQQTPEEIQRELGLEEDEADPQ